MIVAIQFDLDDEEATQQRAIVTDLTNLRTGVVCVYQADIDGWEPVYFIQIVHDEHGLDVGIKRGLPPCFELNDAALHALRNLIHIETDVGEED